MKKSLYICSVPTKNSILIYAVVAFFIATYWALNATSIRGLSNPYRVAALQSQELFLVEHGGDRSLSLYTYLNFHSVMTKNNENASKRNNSTLTSSSAHETSNSTTKELKANLDLYGVLLKLRECEIVFNKQYDLNCDVAGFAYEEILDEFSSGLYHAMNAVKDLIGESALNEVYDVLPAKR